MNGNKAGGCGMATFDFDKLTIMNDFMFGTVMRKRSSASRCSKRSSA